MRRNVDRDLDRILTRLRHAIRERGYTQLEVQEVMGWGRSYISHLLTRQKSLRLDQLLQILNVIGVDPADFYGEIYQFGQFSDSGGRRGRRGKRSPLFEAAAEVAGGTMLDDLRRMRVLLDAVVTVLAQKNLIAASELDAATRKFRQTQLLTC